MEDVMGEMNGDELRRAILADLQARGICVYWLRIGAEAEGVTVLVSVAEKHRGEMPSECCGYPLRVQYATRHTLRAL